VEAKGSTPRTRQSAGAEWQRIKPRFFALVIGLLAGPVITNLVGLQILTSTAARRAQAGLVEQQAQFCEARARAEVPHPASLDWNGRNELARRFAAMPGATATREAAFACALRLSG
jgi:hypothetical protein